MRVNDAHHAVATARAKLGSDPALKWARAELDAVADALATRMRIALVGRVSAGKSTLANALLGGYRAPTGPQELTYHVTWIQHGKRPALEVCMRNGHTAKAVDIAELERYVRCNADHADLEIEAIEYLKVTDPAAYLRSFDLVDTPGLDSVFGSDSDNTLRFLGGPVDAMLLVFARAMHEHEPELLRDFRGHSLSPDPINAIAALTKVEHYWSWRDGRDPMLVGRELAEQMMTVPAVASVTHEVLPVASLVAASAATLTEQDVMDLRRLAELAPECLTHWARRESAFGSPTYDVEVPPQRRLDLWQRLTPYGIALATDLIRQGAEHRDALRRGLDERSGMAALRHRLVGHFGNRAELIKINRAYSRIQSMPDSFGADLQPSQHALLNEAVKEFSRYALAQMPQFRELAMLRAYYAGSLELPAAAAAELLRMSGERGRRTCDRLDLPADSTREQLLEHASARLKYWRIRQVGGGFVGPTREAVRLLARSYERVVEQIRDLRWTEER